MKFYTKQHKYYCGADLHAKSMYICIIDKGGAIVKHKNIPSDAYAFLHAVDKYREDIVVSVECMFTWYRLADLCQRENIPFVLGHALYMKAFHGGKAKALTVLAHKLARAVYYILKRKEVFNIEKFLKRR